MSEPNDLSPLLSDPGLGADLRSVLEGAGAHEPAAADLAQLGKKLANALPPGTLPGGGGGAGAGGVGGGVGAGAVSGAGSALKLSAALGVIAVVGLAAYFAGGAREPAAPSPLASVADTASAPPVEPTSSVALVPIDPVAPTASAASSAAPTASATTAAITSAAPAESEAAILARAHEALLHGAPDKALVLTNEHAKAYPHGTLSQEREAIAIEALVAAGRAGEARRRADAFRAAYPGSSHQERIDRLVGPPASPP